MRLIYCQKKKVKMKELKVGERVVLDIVVTETVTCAGCSNNRRPRKNVL